jgi:hypothetical protein
MTTPSRTAHDDAGSNAIEARKTSVQTGDAV